MTAASSGAPWRAPGGGQPHLCYDLLSQRIVEVPFIAHRGAVVAPQTYRRNPDEAFVFDLPCPVLSIFHCGFGRRGHVALQRGPQGQDQGQVWLRTDTSVAGSCEAVIGAV